MNGILEAIAVSKRFGETLALDGVSLQVNAGEVFCLLGANGAGKTTLVNIFLNFIAPTSGEARVDGRDVTRHALAAKRDMAYIPEQVMLYGVLSGLENLRYFAALATGEDLPERRALELLRQVGLDETAARRRIAEYSKGMRQKVGIAIASAKHAKAFLLDEPTSGLDPKAANEFSQLLRTARDKGVAVLTTTHDLFHAKQTGSRIGIMRRGRLVENLLAADISHLDLESLYLKHMSNQDG